MYQESICLTQKNCCLSALSQCFSWKFFSLKKKIFLFQTKFFQIKETFSNSKIFSHWVCWGNVSLTQKNCFLTTESVVFQKFSLIRSKRSVYIEKNLLKPKKFLLIERYFFFHHVSRKYFFNSEKLFSKYTKPVFFKNVSLD